VVKGRALAFVLVGYAVALAVLSTYLSAAIS
jgi:hypothetical protein